MRITAITSNTFKSNIIDAHAHRGSNGCLWNGIEFPTSTLDSFIKSPLTIDINGNKQTDNVVKILVSSIDGLALDDNQRKELKEKGIEKHTLKPEEVIFAKNEIQANLEMINKYKNDNFYAVMAVCQPSKTVGSANNIKQLLKEHPNTNFGLKFHPQDMLLNADSPLYDSYMKLADKEKLPCLFHSQVNIDYNTNTLKPTLNWSDPELIYKLAKRHPKVPVVMGHMGAGNELAHTKAIEILEKSIINKDAKLFVDISWVDFKNDLPAEHPNNIIKLIDKMKELNALDRILFGTDAPLGCYGEPHKLEQTKLSPKEAYELTISRIKTAIKNKYGNEADNIINKIFYENAEELFFKKEWAKTSPKPIKNVGLIASSIFGAGAIAFIIQQLTKSKKSEKELILQARPHRHTRVYSNPQ